MCDKWLIARCLCLEFSISEWGLGGTIGGSVLISCGVLLGVLMAISRWKVAKYENDHQQLVSNVRHNALEAELNNGIISDELNDNEIFVTMDETFYTIFMPRKKGTFAYQKYDFQEGVEPHENIQATLASSEFNNKLLVYKEEIARRIVSNPDYLD